MECFICGKAYNNERIPRIMDCGHTFCEVKFFIKYQKCLYEIQNKSSFIIICIICKEETKQENIKKLIKNISLIPQEISNNKDNKISQYNKNNKAIMFEVNSIRNSNNFEDNSYGRYSLPTGSPFNKIRGTANNISKRLENNLCKIHSKALEAYCTTEKKLICITCILEKKHENHNIIGIAEAFQLENEEISKLECELEDSQNYLFKQMENLNKFEDAIITFKNKNIDKMKNFYSNLLIIISEMESESKNNFNKKFENELLEIKNIKLNVQNLLNNERKDILDEIKDIRNGLSSHLEKITGLKEITEKTTPYLIKIKEELNNNLIKIENYQEEIKIKYEFNTSDELSKISFKLNNQILNLINRNNSCDTSKINESEEEKSIKFNAYNPANKEIDKINFIGSQNKVSNETNINKFFNDKESKIEVNMKSNIFNVIHFLKFKINFL